MTAPWVAGHTENLPGSRLAVTASRADMATTTEYQHADALARRHLKGARLLATGDNGYGRAVRVYIRPVTHA